MKKELYRFKLHGLQDCLALVHSDMDIILGTAAGEPVNFLSALHTLPSTVRNVRLIKSLDVTSYPYLTDESTTGRFKTESIFLGSGTRPGHESGNVSLIPSFLGDAFRLEKQWREDSLFVCSVSPMDEEGNVYLSMSLQWDLHAIDKAGTVVFEVNRNIPIVYGKTKVSIERADYIYEVDTPVPTIKISPPNEVEKAIAQYVSDLVKDGDCIQLGIGGTPNAIAIALMERRHLGIHTEMITSSMVDLIECGAVDCSRKTIHNGKCIGSFVLGDQRLYDYLHKNALFELHPTEYVNNPFIIAQNDNMVSINTALQIDLTGQVCSESLGPRQYTGTGGAADFAYGAYRSKNGRGILAFSSTAKGGTISRIQPMLSLGSAVSISRNIVDHVVTEFGVARLKGRSVTQRVNELIAVSHPKFRDELKFEARKNHIW